MKQDTAETIALQALVWLTQDEARLSGFMLWSGAAPDDLRAQAAKPEFLAAVIDFVMLEDQQVLDFCANHGLPPARLQQVRAALPGGTTEHWT